MADLGRRYRPNRRKFLALAGLTMGAGAGVAAFAELDGRRRGQAAAPAGGSPVSRPAPRSAEPAEPPRPADWAALRRELAGGRLVRPGSPDYAAARLLFDPKFDDSRPGAIAYCSAPEEVSACLEFVRKFGLPVAVRSGGHSYGGWSTTSGLVLDVTPMAQVRLNASAGTARVGAGTLLIDLYSQLAGQGVTVPAGSCPTVGVAGLALGGGVGVIGRLYGLTCDSLIGVQIVTADGVVRECDASMEPDLFWACRGGGGGSFGVVTAFTFRTRPAPDLVLFYLTWPWAAAANVVAAWQDWAPFASDELWSNLHLSAEPGGSEPRVSVGGTCAGGTRQLEAALETLYSATGSRPGTAFIRSEQFLTAMLVEAGCSEQSVQACHLPSQHPAGVLTRPPEYAKSDFFTSKLPAGGIRQLIDQVQLMGQVAGASGASGSVAFDACGGAINRVRPGATAFVHRDALFLAQYSTSWTASGDRAGAGTAEVARQRAWLAGLHAAMRPYASGQAYQNYADPDLADWQRAYYGANYPRLQRVKAAADPADLFRFPQSVELPA
ncbi:MAG TPA: FAD-binding oxidoreductase [Streptosporangiaceae bacterium]|nr:FAD-binding oxidoreductase [Streptosporangiaceae bacterium]